MAQTNFTFTSSFNNFNSYHPQKKENKEPFLSEQVRDVHHDSYHYHPPSPKEKKNAETFDTQIRPTFTTQGCWFLYREDTQLPQELDQARPAEEIWLDALITVLEEAGDGWSAGSGSGLEGGQVIYRDLFSKKNQRWDSRRPKGCENNVVMCMFDVFDCEGLFVSILQNDEDEAISNGKTNAFWRHPSPNR